MQRTVWTVAAALVLAAGVATAQQPPNTVMGNWEGKFTSPGWEARTISAQVIAEFSNEKDAPNSYRAIFHIGGDGANPTVEALGTTNSGKTVLSGQADLGAKLGGSSALSAVITEGKLTGTLSGEKGKAAFELSRVEKKSPTLGAAPPAGAIVLLDGSDLDLWTRIPEKWPLVEGGAMQVSGSQFATKQEFGDCTLHLEFRTPFMPTQRGQGRGNSGVYVQGRYEVQVLDSFGLQGLDNECGGIYKESAPKVNACLPPLEWQTYDITFHAARFNEAGQKTQNAEITVDHNGTRIHDGLKMNNPTPGGVSDQDAKTGPLMLQDHGNAVQYRNIWLLPLQDK